MLFYYIGPFIIHIKHIKPNKREKENDEHGSTLPYVTARPAVGSFVRVCWVACCA